MHDAGPTDLKETVVALIQGNGAIVFASPEEQAKHEAFVLAPKYNKKIVDIYKKRRNMVMKNKIFKVLIIAILSANVVYAESSRN